MTVRLEPLRYEDVGRCAELERILFAGEDPWSERAFTSELDSEHNYYLGAYTDSGLVGYAGLALAGPPRSLEGEVHTIGVDPAWQGRGVGRALLRALLDQADEVDAPVFLEVRTDNAPAIALYEAHGFQRVGVRRNYYQPSGADAYTMVRRRRSGD